MASEIHVRMAGPGENQALLNLSRSCPMEADISLSIERDPDFFALSRARGEGRTYVAEVDGRIVGCGGVCRRRAYVLGSPSEIGYVGDLKVAPEFRRRGVARRILDVIARDESSVEAAPYVGTAAAGNADTERMLHRFGHDRHITRLGRFTSYQLLPFRRMRVEDRFEIRPARLEDEADLASLLDSYHRRLTFAPVFHDGGLQDLLERSPGMELDSYRIARRRGRLVAALAMWDESGMKHTRIRRMNRRLRWMSRVVRTHGPKLGLPSFPAEGDLLRFVYLRHAAHVPGHLDALSALVRSVMLEVAECELHFALFTCADDDEIVRCLRGIPRTTYRYTLLGGSNSREFEPHLEVLGNACLYDDAALA